MQGLKLGRRVGVRAGPEDSSAWRWHFQAGLGAGVAERGGQGEEREQAGQRMVAAQPVLVQGLKEGAFSRRG